MFDLKSLWKRNALAVVPVLMVIGCSETGPYEISEVREVTRTINAPQGSAQRFGFSPQSGMTNSSARSGPAPSPLSWELPEGWVELPATQMRQANFQVAGNQNTECYLTVLPGTAGGVAANVNRWRTQMGAEPLAEEAMGNLQRRALFGRDAVLVDLQGDFQGMGGEAQSDFRLFGLILDLGQRTLFLKMTGPSNVVAQQIENFELLADSMQINQSSPSSSSPSPSPSAARGITWDRPDSWTRAADRSMRLVTLVPEGSSQSECYLTLLGGNAGGTLANVNRWRSQMGLAPLSPRQLSELPRRRMLGVDATLVEIEGEFSGMSGDTVNEASLLGVVCELRGQVLFVKMTGPKHEMISERERFMIFCESIHFEDEG